MIKALGKRVLLEPFIKENKTSKGLYLSSDNNDFLIKCKVISLGIEVKLVKENDIVLIDKKMGLDIKYLENKYILINEEDILIKVEENE